MPAPTHPHAVDARCMVCLAPRCQPCQPTNAALLASLPCRIQTLTQIITPLAALTPGAQRTASFTMQRQHSPPLWPAGQAEAALAPPSGARLPGPSECINPTQHCYSCLVPLPCLILRLLCTALYCACAILHRPLSLEPPPSPAVLTAATVKQFVSHMVGASNKYASIETKKVKKLRS